MAALRSGQPYTRLAWNFPDQRFAGSAGRVDPDSRFVPPSQLRIKEAIELYGAKEVEGWDGTEENARLLLGPPEPPWEAYRREDGPLGFLIFGDDGEALFVDEAAASAWWTHNEPGLRQEWRTEKRAGERWITAVEGLRGLLADGRLSAAVLTDSGHIQSIPVQNWLGTDGGGILIRGYARIHIMVGYSSFKFEGIVLVSRGALEAIWAAKQPTPTASELDPGLHPYLDLMLTAAKVLPFARGTRMPKDVIEKWLRENWPPALGPATDNKIRGLATFLRRPEDEGGGNLPPPRTKAPGR
jgi:hypothetical protein